jgi:hypothetical protein
MALPSDMMSRFEALSRAFRSEVEGLVDEEKAASRETSEQLHARIADLEDEVFAQDALARKGAARIRSYLGQQKPAWLEHIFGDPEPPEAPEVTVAGFIDIIQIFASMSESNYDPELEAAHAEISNLRQQVSSQDAELTTLRDDLREARILKTQEERDLCEFRALREKESELQDAHLKVEQLQSQLEEMQSAQKIVLTRVSQSEASLAEKSRKIVTLMKQVEQETEQCRQLSNENNTLRLNLGKDSDYIKAVNAPADPLSYRTCAGTLGEDLQCEEQRFRDELSMSLFKFPGLATGSDNCRGWCEVQLSRQCTLYSSFLHMLQDASQDTPGAFESNFVSKTREVDEAWLQREGELRDSDAAFHECEKSLAKAWEEKRLELSAERDAKIKQLMEQAERSQTRAEKQLLMQQAKLFGQRMDTQIERAWDDQRKERDERWAQHNQAKQESRQKFKEKALLMQQEVESVASAADRFQDMAKARLAGPEDAWVRNLDKVTIVSASAFRGLGLRECLKAAGFHSPRLPQEGSQFGGISSIVEIAEDVLGARLESRKEACKELQGQTLQQLRHCVERFILHEGMQQPKKGAALSNEVEKPTEHTHATTIQALLRARQHRVVADTLRRQFYDFMVALRVLALGAVYLLPEDIAKQVLSCDGKLDLPAVPEELKGGVSVSLETDASCIGRQLDESKESLLDEQVEGQFLYNSLMQRLLERLLTSMHSKHREELLCLKRTHAKEIRQTLQHLCQLEPTSIDKCSEIDLAEYKTQIKTKLMSDCEYHVCEERRQLGEQIDEEVDMHVRIYQHQMAEEERAAVRDRRKLLMERLVVLQAQGVGCSGERAVIQHLRSELRACELRFELRDRELSDAELTISSKESPLEHPHQKAQRTPSPGLRSFRADVLPSEQTAKYPSHGGGKVGQAYTPAPPSKQPPANKRPLRGSSPKPPNDMTFPIGRPSGGAHACNSSDLAGAGPPSYTEYESRTQTDADRKRPPAANTPQSPRKVKEDATNSPIFGAVGADGAAGFGRVPPSPSFGEDVDLAKRGPSEDVSETLLETTLPLYDWPFAASDVMCEKNVKSAGEIHRQKHTQNVAQSVMADILPPVKLPMARPTRSERFNFSTGDAGISSGMVAPTAGPNLKSPRQIPQLLPPVTSP